MKAPICKICWEDFTDESGCRVPKTLHCSHSMCHDCASRSVVNNGIVCPFCRETTQLGPEGVQSLKKNFGLLEVIGDAKFSGSQLAEGWVNKDCNSVNLREVVRTTKETLTEAEKKTLETMSKLQERRRLSIITDGNPYQNEINRIDMHFKEIRRHLDVAEDRTLQNAEKICEETSSFSRVYVFTQI